MWGPNPLRKSQRRTRAASGEDSSGRHGAIPKRSSGRGRGQKEIMQAPGHRFQLGPQSSTQVDPNRPRWAGQPPPPPFTRSGSFTSLSKFHSEFSKKMPNLAALQPGPASCSAEARPPTNECS